MCEFCENPTKWNTDDYSLVPNRNLSDGIMQAEDNTHQIGVFNSYSDFWEVMDIDYCPICGRKLGDETETPIEHFLKSEIERSKLRMNAYAECFDGVHVDNDTRKKLLESHIRFCKNALKQCMDA